MKNGLNIMVNNKMNKYLIVTIEAMSQSVEQVYVVEAKTEPAALKQLTAKERSGFVWVITNLNKVKLPLRIFTK